MQQLQAGAIMTLCFLIKKEFLREKFEEQQRTGTFIEQREYKPFWRARIGSPQSWSKLRKANAAFLCGRYVFYADVAEITIKDTPVGIEDIVTSELCYEITCAFPPEELNDLETFLQISKQGEEQ